MTAMPAAPPARPPSSDSDEKLPKYGLHSASWASSMEELRSHASSPTSTMTADLECKGKEAASSAGIGNFDRQLMQHLRSPVRSSAQPQRRKPASEALGAGTIEVVAQRGTSGLGLDLDERNVIRRVLPGSMAEEQGILAVGDVVLEVDGTLLTRGLLVSRVMAPGRPGYCFKVYRPPDGGEGRPAAPSRGILSTLLRGAAGWADGTPHEGEEHLAAARISRARAAAGRVAGPGELSPDDPDDDLFGQIDALVAARPACKTFVGQIAATPWARKFLVTLSDHETAMREGESTPPHKAAIPDALRRAREGSAGIAAEVTADTSRTALLAGPGATATLGLRELRQAAAAAEAREAEARVCRRRTSRPRLGLRMHARGDGGGGARPNAASPPPLGQAVRAALHRRLLATGQSAAVPSAPTAPSRVGRPWKLRWR